MRKIGTGGRFFHSLNFKLVLCIVGTTIGIVAVCAGFSWYTLTKETARSMQREDEVRLRQVDLSLNVAAIELAGRISGVMLGRSANGGLQSLTAQAGVITTDKLGDQGLIDMVDAIGKAIKGSATVFAFDAAKDDYVRLATNLKKADGSRAIGTMLGKASEANAAIRSNEIYRGLATILGEKHYTGYFPILTSSGAPVGILYIGIGKAVEIIRNDHEFLMILLVGIICILIVALAITVPLFTRMTRPFVELAKITKQISTWDAARAIPYQQRVDEAGILANSLQNLRTEMAQADETRRMTDAEQAEKLARQARVAEYVEEFRLAMAATLEQVNAGIAEMLAMADGLTDVTSKTEMETTSARAAIDTALFNVEAVASASDQLASSGREIAEQASVSSTVVAEALTKGEESTVQVMQLSG